MSGKWEVAGKSKKVPLGKKSTKKQKKEIQPAAVEEETVENFAISNPLKEHRNIYTLMKDETSDQEHDKKQSENKENLITKPRISGKPKPKKKGSPVAQVKRAEREILIEQLEEIDISDMKSLIGDVKKRFPNHPRVWLKDVQSYFHMKVTLRESDSGLMMYESGYPFNMLSSELQDFLSKLFKEIPDPVMIGFYTELLDSLARDVRNGACGYHHRILLQCMSHNCPKTVHSKEVTNKLQSLITDSVARTKECVALLWCLQMIPRNKLDTKLKVWFTCMLPILQTKKTERPVQDYILKCLENVVSEITDSNETIELGPSDFFGYFDLVFSPNSNLFPHVQVVLMELLEEVKCFAFSSNADKRLRSFFPSLLIRLQHCSAKQKTVVLKYLLECLQQDAQCWLLWQQMFGKHLNNSVTLLEHIHDNWNIVIKTANKAALKQTLNYLMVTLTPSSGKTKMKENQRRALELCSDMNHAIGSPLKGALKLALLVMLVVSAAYVLHDVKEFGSFQASRTGRIYSSFLQHESVVQLYDTAKVYGAAVHKHGMTHVPLLMEYIYAICNSVCSTLALFAVFLQTNFNYLIENKDEIAKQMKAAAVDAGERGYGLIKSLATPENMEWAETTAFKYMELCKEYWSWALEHMVQAAAAGQASAVAFYGSAQEFVINNFINDPVTLDRLKEWLLTFSTFVQETAVHFYNTARNATLAN